MRKWIILFLALFLLTPLSVRAQGTVTLDSLKVQLWSEHDQPSMLVIYDFHISPDTLVPTRVDIKIPKEGNITAAAFEENGELLNADFTGPVADGGWQVITFLVQSQTNYHLEYYQPLVRTGDLRTFHYEWTGEYAVKDFRIEIQVPADSTGAKTDPVIPFVQDQPVLSGGAMLSGLEAGQAYQVQLQYSRTSEETVIAAPSAPVEPSEPLDANTDGRVTLEKLPYILGGIGAVLILSALFYSWRASSFQLPKPRKRHPRTEDESAQTYCHQCGARAQAGDRFCRTCGSKLRSG